MDVVVLNTLAIPMCTSFWIWGCTIQPLVLAGEKLGGGLPGPAAGTNGFAAVRQSLLAA
jgi:hypothetical protein